MQPHYHIVILGMSLATGLIATLTSRLGLKVLIIAPQRQFECHPEHILPVFSAPFQRWGLEPPQWPFEWILAQLSGIVGPQDWQPCEGVILNKALTFQGMLADAQQYGTEIWHDIRAFSLQSESKTLVNRSTSETISYDLLIHTRFWAEYHVAPLFTEHEHGYHCFQGLFKHLNLPPGIPEILLSEQGKMLMMPVGQQQTGVFYSQAKPENFSQHLTALLQQRFPQQNFQLPPFTPHWNSYQPRGHLYHEGQIYLGETSQLHIGPWGFVSELELILAQYSAERIIQAFFLQKPETLELLNAYAQRFQAWCLTEGEQSSALYH